MKLKILIIFIFFTLSSAIFPQNRNRELLNLVNRELNEVKRLNKQLGSQNPSLLLRLAEIYLEKARIIKDEENYAYLSLDPNKRKQISRKQAFQKSHKYFNLAQRVCYYILRRFKDYKNKAEVYYILAYNAKEYLELQKAEVFFKRAIASAEPNTFTETKSKLALAEMYYNQKEYAKAKTLYEQVLKDKSQRWWTKDAFNLAWCYFRLGQKQRGIELMNEVYQKSKDPRYINVTEYVERDLAYFYSESGDIDRAVAFYQSIGKDIATNLLSVSKHLVNQGRFSSAEKTLQKTRSLSKNTEPTWAFASLELLDLYQKFGKQSRHLGLSVELYKAHRKKHLSEENKQRFIYQVSTEGKKLQKEVVSKEMKEVPQSQMKKAKMAATYFKIQSQLVPGHTADSFFLAAETLFAANLTNQAIPLYFKALSKAKKDKNQKLSELSLEGLVASLNHRNTSKQLKEKYFASSYEQLLEVEKNPQKRSKIYQSLFSYYLDRKDYQSAEKVLERSSKEKVVGIEQNSVMVASLLDAYRGQSNKDKVLEWKRKIDSKEILVTKDLQNKVNEFSLALEFEGVEELVKGGNTLGAIDKYNEILNSKKSSNEAKKNSAFNLSSLYLTIGEPEKSLEFAKKSLNLMNDEDLRGLSEDYFSLAASYFNYQLIQDAGVFNDLLTRKFCSFPTKRVDSFFKNTVVLYLADLRLKQAIDFYQRYSDKCNVMSQTKAFSLLEIGRLGSSQKNQTALNFSAQSLSRIKGTTEPQIIVLGLSRHLYSSKRAIYKINKKIDFLFKEAIKKKENLSLEALNIVSSIYLESLKNDVDKIYAQKYTFPEKVYNQILQLQFSRLEKITTHSSKILQIGASQAVSTSYRLLVEAYQAVITQVRSFTPSKKSQEYITSFKKSMDQVAGSLEKKKREFENEAKRYIGRYQILSEDNSYFFKGAIPGFTLQQGPAELVSADRRGER